MTTSTASAKKITGGGGVTVGGKRRANLLLIVPGPHVAARVSLARGLALFGSLGLVVDVDWLSCKGSKARNPGSTE